MQQNSVWQACYSVMGGVLSWIRLSRRSVQTQGLFLIDDSDFETNCESTDGVRQNALPRQENESKQGSMGGGSSSRNRFGDIGLSDEPSKRGKRISRKTCILIPIFALLCAGVVCSIIFCAQLLSDNAELKGDVSNLKLTLDLYTNGIQQNSDNITSLTANMKKYQEETRVMGSELNSSITHLGKEQDSLEVILRLVNGSHAGEGLVDIWHEGQWGKICHEAGWYIEQANVICRSLGYQSASRPIRYNDTMRSEDKIWLQMLSCGGNERHITECANDGWGFVLPVCYDKQLYAGVECK